MNRNLIDITSYRTLVFDCDGVVLKSNHIKTKAFYRTALSYGHIAADKFIEYHTQNGGVSRYEKFAYFLSEIVPDKTGPNLDELLAEYGQRVSYGLLTCEISEEIFQLRDKTTHSKWLIVSGGKQDELRDVFAERGLLHLFDGGIFGSPDTKESILCREKSKGTILEPALFLGDSKYDWLASQSGNLDFIFISQWTELKAWEKWAAENQINHVSSLKNLLE